MGSSTKEAAMLRKKLEQANLKINVENSAISEIPENCSDYLSSKAPITVRQAVPN